jgi:hypothetical protein
MARLIPFRAGDDNPELNSRRIFIMALENAPQGQTLGFADFDRRYRVLTTLRAADGAESVVLEDADWDTLKGALAAMRSWVQVPTELMGWLIKIRADLFEAAKIEIERPPQPEKAKAHGVDGKPLAGEPA